MTATALHLDDRDVAIALRDADLLLRLADAEDECETYRVLALEALHALVHETRQHAATRAELARERDQARWLRVHLITKVP